MGTRYSMQVSNHSNNSKITPPEFSSERDLLAERLSALLTGPEAQLVESRLKKLLINSERQRPEELSLDDCLAGKKACLICMTPRSGSTYLSTLMESTGQLGNCLELLNFEDIELRGGRPSFGCLTEYLEEAIKRHSSKTGVFSMKGDLYHYLPLIKKGLIRSGLRQVCFVYLTREDVLAQAVSAFRAIQTGEWSSLHSRRAEPKFDAEGILEQMDILLHMMARWELIFALLDLKPIRITYETLVAQPTETVQNLAKSLGVTVNGTTHSPLAIQRDELSANWTNQIRKVAQAFLQDPTPFRRKRRGWWGRRPKVASW
jgi:LPS sulfotransferase NodH